MSPNLQAPPETMAQAKHWQATQTRYLAVGLCSTCAAQAAWGHQCGFARIHPPCERCRGFELPTEHGDRPRRWLAPGTLFGGDGSPL